MLNQKSVRWMLLSVLGSLFVAVTAFAYGGAAVIVYNPSSGAYGSYHGVPTLAQAQFNAQSLCGGDCAIETYAFNGWVALARNSYGAYGTSGLHDCEYNAEQSAISNCENAAAIRGQPVGACYVLRSTSSYDYMPDQDGVRPNY